MLAVFNQAVKNFLQPRINETVRHSLRVAMSSTGSIQICPGEIPAAVETKSKSEIGLSTKHEHEEDFSDSVAKKLKTSLEVSQEASSAKQEGSSSRQRRKVAVLLAYSGQGYYGMQRNAGVKTIEDELLSAMLKADIISEENYKTPQSMQFQRAARTDKGVSAARQVVSLRIVVEDGLAKKINSFLPPQIQVLDITRATKGFNSKLWCDARTYSYTLPTFAFATITEITTEDYRIPDDVIRKVNDVLVLFKGTHNFHNFTSGRKPGDPSAQRYIMEFECGKPFVQQDLEMVTIKVKGQSFMLHQIRKMIGMTIAIIRDLANVSLIQKTWTKEKIDMPIAPGVGLVLEEVHYEKYNQRYGSDGLHEALDWTALNQTVEDFKRQFINPNIISSEKNDKSMLQWLTTLPLHTYDVRDAGPPGVAAQSNQIRTEIGRALVAVEIDTAERESQTKSAIEIAVVELEKNGSEESSSLTTSEDNRESQQEEIKS